MSAGRAALIHNKVNLDSASWKGSCGGKPGADITGKVLGMMDLARTGKMF